MIVTPHQFKDAFSKLPYVLRSYITDDELEQIVQSVGSTYGLHVNTVGAVYREVTNMLLGLETPEQFSGELRSIGISQEQVSPIMQDLNQKIFIPLRERMQKEGDADPYKESAQLAKELGGTSSSQTMASDSLQSKQVSPSSTLAQNTTLPKVPAPSYTQTPIAPAPSISQFNPQPSAPTAAELALPMPPVERSLPPAPDNLPGTGPVMSALAAPAVPISAPAMSPMPAATYTPPASIIPATPAAGVSVPATETVTHTMKRDMSAVKSGTYGQVPAMDTPAAHAHAAEVSLPQRPSAPISAPALKPQPISVPSPFPKPAAAPISRAVPVNQPRPAAISVQASQSAPAASSSQSQNMQDLHQVLKQYGVDPYREPVE